MSTVQEMSVGDWLNTLHPVYNQYKNQFEDIGISTMKDFFDLSTVDDDVECFIGDLGITNRLHENRLKREIKKFIESKKVIAKIERKEPASDSDDDDDFGDWDNIDDGFSRKVVTKLCKDKNAVVLSKSSSSSSTTANTAASTLGGVLSSIPAAVNTTQTLTKEVTTTTMKTITERHDVIKWGFIHHHYFTTSQVPVTTTQQVTSVVPLAKGVVIGHAAIGAGIASAAMFSLQLGWDLIQYKIGNISKNQLKMRTIKSATTNGSVLVSSIAGSAIGTAIAPGIGTIIGGIIGSIAGVIASVGLNKKWDEHFQKKYPDEFKNFNMDIPDDPEKVLKEAALMFGFSERYLDDDNVFNVENVKRSYKANVRLFHPDHHGSHERFVEFQTNYVVLLGYLKERSCNKKKKSTKRNKKKNQKPKAIKYQ
mmetsp:Transcript_23379/g.28654  ORF Transcript_23379/g.28654 Transcript_23379/m.28654 type:complete len:423 (+) Transcript_23379:78-1346(+)